MIGKSLASGQAADRSLNATFWHPSYPYQPGFAWLAGAMAWIFGGDILGARLLSCWIALLVALLIYFGGRAILGCLPSFFGALLFLSYDQAVIHFRWIYPHNGVALGFTITILALLRSSRPRVDWTAGFGLAVGALSHPLFIHGAAAAWACRIKRPKAWPRLLVPATIVLAFTIGISLVRYWPHLWVFQDIVTLVESIVTLAERRRGLASTEKCRDLLFPRFVPSSQSGCDLPMLLTAIVSHRNLCWHGLTSPLAE